METVLLLTGEMLSAIGDSGEQPTPNLSPGMM